MALVASGILLAQLPDAGRVGENAFCDGDHLLSELGEAKEELAPPNEELDAGLVLEILDVLADARLRSIECGRGFGKVELAPGRFADDAQLLKIHR